MGYEIILSKHKEPRVLRNLEAEPGMKNIGKPQARGR